MQNSRGAAHTQQREILPETVTAEQLAAGPESEAFSAAVHFNSLSAGAATHLKLSPSATQMPRCQKDHLCPAGSDVPKSLSYCASIIFIFVLQI